MRLALIIASIVLVSTLDTVAGPAQTKVGPLSSSAESALKPKDTFRDCDKCPEMVVVPAGSFTMGSPDGELNRGRFEGPQHEVTVARQFAVGEFAVTFEEWDTCIADGGCNGYTPSDEGWGRGRRPVVNVSWSDANAYATWLSNKTGKSYRLLSEAEREYVTRAGTTTPFWWGAGISLKQANYDGRFIYGNSASGEFRRRTLPVDSFQPNPWGLHQVHGNVWEWTQDCWHETYAGAPADGSAWESEGCRHRMIRGGAWYTYPGDLRSAVRGREAAGFRSSFQGFRVARALPLDPHPK
jgi:formylglycine-generating enzyme required for sulfatase activity